MTAVLERPRPLANSEEGEVGSNGVRADYWPFVGHALAGALAVLGVKVLAILFMANGVGIPVEVHLWWRVVPHLSLDSSADRFTTVVSYSTLVMAGAAAIIVWYQVFRSARTQQVVGSFVAVIIVAETLISEVVRHALDPPLLSVRVPWMSLIPLAFGVVGLIVGLHRARVLRRRSVGFVS